MSPRSGRVPRRIAAAAIPCALCACAELRRDPEDAAVPVDAWLPPGSPSEPPSKPTPRFDAEPVPDEPDRGPAPPPPPEPDLGPPPPPPPEPECREHVDCGPDGLCVANACVVDPSAPQRVGNGACTNPADEGILRAAPRFRDIHSQCGLTCLGQPQPCLDGCVATTAGFSSSCAACFGAYMSCIGSICLIPCVLNDDDAADCAECRQTVCDAAYEACSGFRAPQMW